MVIQGYAPDGIESVRKAVLPLREKEGVEVGVHPIEAAVF
jgi:glycine cleavage system transcriptional repressor